MSHSLPHLTLTTTTSSLSPISSTSPIFPTVSSFAHKLCGPRPIFTLRCSTAEWRNNTNPISHRFWMSIFIVSQSAKRVETRSTGSPNECKVKGCASSLPKLLDRVFYTTSGIKFHTNENCYGLRNASVSFKALKFTKCLQNDEPGVDRTPTHNTHLCSTVCSQARNAHHALGSSHHGLHFIFVCLTRICHLVLHMSHPSLFSHPPFATSTSSSSFTLLSTTTQEHAAQPVQYDQLREHPVHHAHLQALPVDKQRHQESLWRENLLSGGNPRTKTPTGYETKELATVSRIEDYSGDPYQL